MQHKDSAILAVGTVAFDSIETPQGMRDRCFGGSASYFSYAASFFARTKILAVVGEDFPSEYKELLTARDVDLSSLEVKKGEKTFFWKGKYTGAMNEAETLNTELNALLTFKPQLTIEDTQPILFLANVDPAIQLQLLQEKKGTKFTVMDTMNFWIASKCAEVKEVISRIDMLIINDGEARQLTGETNLICAGEVLAKMGPSVVVIKKGEHGVLLFYRDKFFALPAFPVKKVCDPTGAGDSFAGGMVGYIAKTHSYEFKTFDFETFKRAVMWGTVVASFTVEDFSLDRLECLSEEELDERYHAFRTILTV